MALEQVKERLTNPPGGDPGLYIDLVGLRRAVMFDIGEHRLSAAELLRVGDLLVSHTHIDHWIGFDRMLRVWLGKDRELRIWGPPGMHDFVWHRIHGYVWNLTFEDHVRFVVHELDGPRWQVVEYSVEDRFQQRREREPITHGGIAATGPGFHVEFAELDHSTPCLGYALVSDARYSFDPERLAAAGLRPGRHLAELKASFLAGNDLEQAATLGHFVPGTRIAYVTDTGYSDRSREAVRRLAHNADVLYCEATYPNSDIDKAEAVRHLTGGQCGALGREAGVQRLVPFHFSRKFASDPSEILADVREAQTGTP